MEPLQKWLLGYLEKSLSVICDVYELCRLLFNLMDNEQTTHRGSH